MYHKNLPDMRSSYDRKAAERDQRAAPAWQIEERQGFLDLLRQEGKNRLLEIGAGPGQDGQFFQQNGLAVVCTDLSAEMVALCRAKGLTAHQMDFFSLDFPPESFDALYARNCLLHVPKAELPQILSRLRAFLKPGGLFYLGLWGGYDFEGIWTEDDYNPQRFFAFYSDDAIQAVVTQVFTLRRFTTRTVNSDTLHYQSMLLQRD